MSFELKMEKYNPENVDNVYDVDRYITNFNVTKEQFEEVYKFAMFRALNELNKITYCYYGNLWLYRRECPKGTRKHRKYIEERFKQFSSGQYEMLQLFANYLVRYDWITQEQYDEMLNHCKEMKNEIDER